MATFLFFEIFGLFEISSSNPELFHGGREKNLRHEADLRKNSTFLGTHQNILDFHNLLYQITTQIKKISKLKKKFIKKIQNVYNLNMLYMYACVYVFMTFDNV